MCCCSSYMFSKRVNEKNAFFRLQVDGFVCVFVWSVRMFRLVFRFPTQTASEIRGTGGRLCTFSPYEGIAVEKNLVTTR